MSSDTPRTADSTSDLATPLTAEEANALGFREGYRAAQSGLDEAIKTLRHVVVDTQMDSPADVLDRCINALVDLRSSHLAATPAPPAKGRSKVMKIGA